MTYGCMIAAVKNSPSVSWFQVKMAGGSVLYAPLPLCSVHVDGIAAAYIMVTCAPLPLC